MERLIILTGPTGIGKTELSLQIAKDYNCEIISSDSMQIYKYMDIGTAKIDTKTTDIKHHMIDIINPDDEFSVSDYKNKVKSIISDINNRNKTPLLVGGTGLYVNSLVYNLNFSNVAANEEFRSNLEKLADEKGNEYLHDLLKEKDIESANKIEFNNRKRVIRALEIAEFSDKKDNKKFREENTDYDLLMIGLNMDRQLLYDQINKRVDQMIDAGLIDEVKNLLDKGYNSDLNSMKAIGYKEIISYLKDEISKKEAIDLIKKNSRHYAKRQLTWFRRDDRIQWFDKSDVNLKENIEKYIGENFERIK